MGYSDRINDPKFKKYVKQSNSYAFIFSVIIAVIAIVGFYIAGEKGVDGMSNPDSLYIGFGIGGMFLLIALFQIFGRKRSKTWDGVVVDKTAKKKKKKVNDGDDNYRTEIYTEYCVVIKSDQGKKYEITEHNTTFLYDYYNLGDKVRHHAGLNSYEKFDKSKDSIVFCAACGTLCNIEEDHCPRCKCPLLK